jgi:hypothetical protein
MNFLCCRGIPRKLDGAFEAALRRHAVVPGLSVNGRTPRTQTAGKDYPAGVILTPPQHLVWFKSRLFEVTLKRWSEVT